MVHEPASLDITDVPELARLVEDVRRTGEPYVLCRDSKAVAVLAPLPPAKRRRATGRVLTEADPLFGLVGIGDSGIPGGISGKKREALARLRHT